MKFYEVAHLYLTHLTHLIDLLSIAVIVWGFLIACKDLLIYEFAKIQHKTSLYKMREIRVTLGSYILFGLELIIASDIITSIVSRSVEQLVNLVIIVIIRTTISYFLGRETSELPGKK